MCYAKCVGRLPRISDALWVKRWELLGQGVRIWNQALRMKKVMVDVRNHTQIKINFKQHLKKKIRQIRDLKSLI